MAKKKDTLDSEERVVLCRVFDDSSIDVCRVRKADIEFMTCTSTGRPEVHAAAILCIEEGNPSFTPIGDWPQSRLVHRAILEEAQKYFG